MSLIHIYIIFLSIIIILIVFFFIIIVVVILLILLLHVGIHVEGQSVHALDHHLEISEHHIGRILKRSVLLSLLQINCFLRVF